jgi:DNA-directed RNA polymerase subunit M/transcription elongation factor TFIIS
MTEKRVAQSDGQVDQTDQEHCPRCGAADAVMSLLTSMNKYLACLHCHHRWQLTVGTK